jgi:hypothetical protein
MNVREFWRGFFWRQPAPYHRAFHSWMRGGTTSLLLLIAAVIVAVLSMAFWLGRATA